jgi:isopentenyldiphosphate isomerase
MMPEDEILAIYSETQEEPKPCARGEFYAHLFDIYAGWHPGVTDVLIFNVHCELLLQQRALHKKANPGRYSTSVGGHINFGERPEFTVVHECMEEIGVPFLLFSEQSFSDAYRKLAPYTKRAALGYLHKAHFQSVPEDVSQGHPPFKQKMWLHFARYDGPVESVDGDAMGFEWRSLAVLQEERRKHPERFANVFHRAIEQWQTDVESFVARYCTM